MPWAGLNILQPVRDRPLLMGTAPEPASQAPGNHQTGNCRRWSSAGEFEQWRDATRNSTRSAKASNASAINRCWRHHRSDPAVVCGMAIRRPGPR